MSKTAKELEQDYLDAARAAAWAAVGKADTYKLWQNKLKKEKKMKTVEELEQDYMDADNAWTKGSDTPEAREVRFAALKLWQDRLKEGTK